MDFKFQHLKPNERVQHFEKYGIKYGFIGKNNSTSEKILAHYANQVHGTQILQVPHSPTHPKLSKSERAHGDGLFTLEANLPLATKTADCVPVLLASKKRLLVMTIHAGWRGLSAGILYNAVATIRSLDAKPEDILAIIGPAVCGSCYEVDEDVADIFTSCNFWSQLQLQNTLQECGKGKWRLDLPHLVAFALINEGVPSQHIAWVDSCTKENHELWHSYRRDRQSCGSNWSWLSL